MKRLTQAALATGIPALLVAGLLSAGPARAAGQTDDPTAGSESGQTDTLSRKDEKQQAKEARINEYYRKKEERRAARDLRKQAKAEGEVSRQVDAMDVGTTAAVATASATAGPKKAKAGSGEPSPLPRELAEAQERLRASDFADDPSVQAYMELIDKREASPHQLAAFGNFLGQNGLTRDALIYYSVALRLERTDPVLWVNVGTLHRKLGELNQAAAAYNQALAIQPSNAYAHYNLGATMDGMGKYEDAIREYKIALTLDPTLGDPASNPQATNNDRLLAVKLMLYSEQEGNLGLPLVDVPGGEVDSEGNP